MRIAALFSGGKDSTYALYLVQQRGWEVTSLVTVVPRGPDAMLFHVPDIHLAPLLSECLGIPLVSVETDFGETCELDALRNVLGNLSVDGLVIGAIASDYQRSRVDAVCHDLRLRCYVPLWRRDQAALLKDYLMAGFRIIVTGVAAEGLDESWLGRMIDEDTRTQIMALNRRYRLSPCGEGGEFETLVIDGPNFQKRLDITDARKEFEGASGVYKVLKAEVVPK